MAIADGQLVDAGLEKSGRQFRASRDDAMLLIPVEAFEEDVAIYTVALTALDHDRILAIGERDRDGAPSATLTWRSANATQATGRN